MKTKPIRSLKFSLALLAALAALGAVTDAQNATWSGGAGNTDWNNALNWDIGVPAEGTNAVVGAGFTVDYNAAMAAGSFGTLTANSPLNINAGGFVVGASGNAAATFTGSAGVLLSVNSGGVFSVTNGGVTASTSGGVTVAAGGSLSASGLLSLGASGSGNVGFLTNNGGDISVGGLRINPNNNSASARAIILGGSNYLGDVTIFRSSSGSAAFRALGEEGLIISNGMVNLASLVVGAQGANSALTMQVAGGAVTNTGTFIVSQVSGGNSRPARYLQQGGIVVSTVADGIRVGVSNGTQVAQFIVAGGTNIAERFLLGDGTNGVTGVTVNFTNAAKVYIGNGGIVSNNVNTLNVALNNGGTFGANASWTGGVSIILAGGAFNCANLDGSAQDITLNGVLRGSGALNKNGAGKLTLNAVNSYSGNTVVNQGTLAVGASGSIASSPQISVASGAALDVSAAGFTLASTRSLTGSGTVIGDVAVASGATINPGSSAGTLTLANSLTVTGAAVLHFDLSPTPGPGNDLLVVNADLNATGANTIDVIGGGSPGTVYTLIQYGGNFNGTLGNFTISGASGILSNDAPSKTIALVIESAVRSPTNVVWVGNASVNDWDTVNRTNWLNTGTGLLDYFVAGDNALFDDTGAANPLINIVGNNAPATVTVGAAASYTFSGSGAISGAGNLFKTNTGTLTITNVNTYSGATTIAGGVLEAGTLANGGSPSSIGAAASDPANLVLDGATLRYLGTSVSIDRPATLGAGGGTLDVASNGSVLAVGGTVVGGALTKAGPGQLTLAVANTYTNGTTINAGTLQVNNNAAAGTAGVTNNGATLRIQGALVLDNLVNFQGDCGLEFNGVGGNNTALRGAWSGNGTVGVYFVTANAGQTFTMGGAGAGGGNMWDFSGTVNFGTNTGFLRINNDNSTFNYGSSNATFNVGTGNAALNQRNGGTVTHLGALIGGPNTKLAGRGNTGTSGTTTYSIGGNNLSTTFAGEINNGSGTTVIVKVGTGTLTLSGASIYTGSTTVSNGVLALRGSGVLSNTPLIDLTVEGILDSSLRTDGALPLGASQVLTGEGTVRGSVTAGSGAVVSPGENSLATPAGAGTLGTLTVTNALVLAAGSTLVIDLDASNGTNDVVTGLASVTYGGTLELSYFSTTFTTGARFKLFHADSYAGAFANINPPTPGPNQSWDTGRLTVDGTLGVSVAHPAFSVVNRLGSDLGMSGPNGIPYGSDYVLASTNVALPLINWTPVATNTFEFDGSFSFTNAVDVNGPPQYFLLQVPQ